MRRLERRRGPGFKPEWRIRDAYRSAEMRELVDRNDIDLEWQVGGPASRYDRPCLLEALGLQNREETRLLADLVQHVRQHPAANQIPGTWLQPFRQSALELLSGAPGLRPADEHEKHPFSSSCRRGQAGRKGFPALRIHYNAQRALQ